MTDNATPEPKRAPRPTKFPAHLAAMISAEMKREIVDAAAGLTQGEVIRRRLELGKDLDDALAVHPELEANVRRLAREGGVVFSSALATLVDFAVREADRRSERNANAAAALARSMAEVDGAELGGVSISLE